jgi:hypothetical protein
MPASPRPSPASAPGSSSIQLNEERQHQSLVYRTPRQAYEAECRWICGRSASPTGRAFAHIPTGTTTNHRIDIDEAGGRSDAMTSRQARSEPVPKSAGLHLRRRRRLSHDRGPPQGNRIPRGRAPVYPTAREAPELRRGRAVLQSPLRWSKILRHDSRDRYLARWQPDAQAHDSFAISARARRIPPRLDAYYRERLLPSDGELPTFAVETGDGVPLLFDLPLGSAEEGQPAFYGEHDRSPRMAERYCSPCCVEPSRSGSVRRVRGGSPW